MFVCPFTRSFLGVACTLALLGCAGSPPAATTITPTTASEGRESTPLAESASALAGAWRCSGAIHGPDGPAPSEVTLDVELDLELDEAWLQTAFAVTSGKYPYKFTSYRTFDAASNTWVAVILDNFGGHTVSRSTDGVTWTGESSGPMGGMKIRDKETVGSPGQLKMLGEYLLDGTSWRTGYDLSCAK
jgi:hypothetical protein